MGGGGFVGGLLMFTNKNMLKMLNNKTSLSKIINMGPRRI